MFEILIWIVIAVAIYMSKAKKAQSQTQKQSQSQSQTQSQTPNGMRQGGVYYQRQQPQNKNFAVIPEQKKVLPNVERKCMVEDKHRSENNVYHQKTPQQTSVPNVKREYTQGSKETREERKATRMIAKRLYEGDSVPQGYRMVKCRYCAAENLIAYASRGKYMCYFCHDDL